MKKLPLETFFRDRERFNFKFSPDLKKLAFIGKYKKRTNIFLQDVKTGKEEVLTTQQRRNINDFNWKGNDIILFMQDNDGDENHHLYAANVKTKETTDLTPWKNVKVIMYETFNREYYLKKMERYRDVIGIAHNQRDPSAFDFYFINLKTNKYELIAQNTVQKHNDVFDVETEKFYYEMEVKLGKSDYYLLKDGQHKFLFSVSSKDMLQFLGLDKSKNYIYYFSNVDRDKVALYKSDIAFKNKPELIFVHDKVDLESLKMNYSSRELEYVTYSLAKKEKYYFSDKVKTKHQHYLDLLYKSFPIEKRSVINFGNHIFEDKVVYLTSFSDNKLVEEYYIDLKTNEIKRLSTPDKDLTPQNLTTMEPISYKARDGLEIRGYLTLPKDQKGPVPMIVNPHGGPWVRDHWGYNSEVQFLANNGYGVFQPNFRISVGYGKEHYIKGWKQWGKDCQNDVTDGTKWLIEKGYTKDGMIGIYGGSYGGYATLMGIVREPKLYSAAIDYCGISDLFSFWDGFPPYWKMKGNIFEEAMGNPHKNKKLAREVSPIYHIDKIKMPLLVVQGATDPRVPQHQADLIVKKLKENNKPVEYLLKADEGHGFRNQENKFELYRRVVSFFDKHLKQ